MIKQYYFINDCPRSAVTLSGRMNEGFYQGQRILLASKETKRYYPKFVERVVDAGDGTCVLDLRWAIS
jgi:hypothetical protein